MKINKKVLFPIFFLLFFFNLLKVYSSNILNFLPDFSIITRYYHDPEIGYYAIVQPTIRFNYNLSKKIKFNFNLRSPRYNIGGWTSSREKFDSRSTPFDLVIPLSQPETNYNNVIAIDNLSLSIENGLPFASDLLIGDLWINLSPYFASEGYQYSGMSLKKESDEVQSFQYDSFFMFDKVGNYFYMGQYIPFVHEALTLTFRNSIGLQYVNRTKFINEKVRSADMCSFNVSVLYHYDKKTPGLRFFSDLTRIFENDYASTVLDKDKLVYYVNGNLLNTPVYSQKTIAHFKLLFKPEFLFWSGGIEYTYLDNGLRSLQYSKALLSWLSSDFPDPPDLLYSEHHHVSSSYYQMNYEKYNKYFDNQQGIDLFLQYKYFNYIWVKGSIHSFHDVDNDLSFNRRYLLEIGTSIFQGLIFKNWTGLKRGGLHQEFGDDIILKNEIFNETGLFLMPFNFLAVDVAYKIFKDDKRVEYPDINNSFYCYISINLPFFPELSINAIYKYTKYNVVENTGEIVYTKGGYYIDESDYFPDNYYRIDIRYRTYFSY